MNLSDRSLSIICLISSIISFFSGYFYLKEYEQIMLFFPDLEREIIMFMGCTLWVASLLLFVGFLAFLISFIMGKKK
jgi:hypothetical protein